MKLSDKDSVRSDITSGQKDEWCCQYVDIFFENSRIFETELV